MEDFKYQSKAHCSLILVLLLLLSVLNVKLAAQAHQHTGKNSALIQQEKQKIFEHRFGLLDFTGFTTDILYNKAGQHLDQWNYLGEESDPVLETGDWQQLYHQYDRSNIKEEAVLSLAKMKAGIKESKNLTPIGVLNFSCQRIGREAISEKWITEEGGRFKREGNPMFPYWEYREIFAVAPIYQTLKGLDQKFILNSAEVFGNLDQMPDEMMIDFADGNGMSIQPLGAEIPVGWQEAGEKEITIKLRFGDKWKVTRSIILLKEIDNYKGGGDDLAVPDVLWDAPNYHGDAKGTLGIYSGCDDGDEGFLYFKKVMLLVEGFDPRNDRSFYTELDDDELNRNTYYVSNQQGLLDSMRNLGWTVIVLDHADGGADIAETAMLTVSAIQYINNVKSGDDPIIVAGASMGATVTRYALAWMENEGIEHETKLWLSIDGPMEGANIPLCVQHSFGKILTLIDYVSGKLGEWAETNLDALNTVAAHQMLIYHHEATDGSNNKAYESYMKTEFDEKMHALNPETNGYPVNCRKVAVANGSVSGTPLEGDIGEPFVDMEISLSVLGKINFILSPVGDFESTDVISLSAEALGVLEPLGLDISFGLLTIDNTGPIDLAPGGYADFHALPGEFVDDISTVAQVVNTLLNILSLGSLPDISWDYMVENPYHSFVPITSALGIAGEDYLMDVSEYTMGMEESYPPVDNWSDICPFDAVFASHENEPHVLDGITAKIAEFVRSEGIANNIYITNREIVNDEEHWAKDTLYIGATMPYVYPPQVQGNVTLSNNSHLHLKAGNEINFFPGYYTTPDGSTVTTELVDLPEKCDYQNKMFEAPLIPYKEVIAERKDDSVGKYDAVKKSGEMQIGKATVYPNPVVDELNINVDIKMAGKYHIELKSLDAKITNKLDGLHYFHEGYNKVRYKVNHFRPGIYLLSITGNNFTESEKIIIQ